MKFYKKNGVTVAHTDELGQHVGVAYSTINPDGLVSVKVGGQAFPPLLFEEVFKEDGTTPIGTDVASAQLYLVDNTVFSSAKGGSLASDFDPTVIINETFSGAYPSSKYTILTPGSTTVADVGGNMRVTCSQAEVASGSNLGGGNGIRTTGISGIVFTDDVYPVSGLSMTAFDYTVKVITAPTSGRRYLMAGRIGTGIKSPAVGGFLFSVSSTLANNHFFVNQDENARNSMNTTPIVSGDILNFKPRFNGSDVQYEIWRNGSLIGLTNPQRAIGSHEQDQIGRSLGRWFFGGWGLAFEPINFKLIDFQPNKYDFVIFGDSIVQGWGVGEAVPVSNYANRTVSTSGKIGRIIGTSALCLQEATSLLHEVTRGLKDGGEMYVALGVNDVDNGRTNVQIQGYLSTFITAVNALGKGYKIIFCTIPPTGASAPKNTVSIDFSAWFLANASSLGVTPFDLRLPLVNGSNDRNVLLFQDLLHPNAIGHDRVYQKMRIDLPQLF